MSVLLDTHTVHWWQADARRNPIDRLIYASAHDLRIPLITKDEQLRAYAARAQDLDVIW